MPFAIYQFIDKRVVTLVLSAGFCDLFGYDSYPKAYYDMDNDMYKETHPDDAARIADAAFRFATEDGKYDVIYRSLNKQGDGYRIIHAKGEHYYTDTGVRLAQVWYTDEGCYSEDDSKTSSFTHSLSNVLCEESFIKATYYDHLTGLPSMTYFFELADIKRKQIKSNGGRPALLYMDLSGMKYFNHKFGFAEGDTLLQCFARTLAESFGNENCSRLGQDHFAAVVQTSGLDSELEMLFEKCRHINEGRSLSVHVGVYQHWYDGIAASMACDRAKFACDTLRHLYSSGYSYYNLSMKDEEEKQRYIISNLDKALSEGWITAYYQPIVRAVNGRVCDEEALARWIAPEKGMLSPADFIPILEDHKLIYKLDLYMVDCIIKKIGILRDAGLHLIPQSVNLSRSDFDTCDIVEEICRRVDAAGISHDMLNVEITESIIGQDFEFMKEQINRFRERGFAVWMDDFGSGYSSLDVLQSIDFDLIKFDMRFMQKLNEGNTGKIILSELMKMATFLGIDTVCEGVETPEQVQFLQETGCSKLQGYYFQKPIPVEGILQKYEKGIQIGFENPEESDYYDTVGRINLHDLSFIAQGVKGGLDNYFNILPMAVIEIYDGQVRFARTNQSYREFMDRYFAFKVNDKHETYHDKPKDAAEIFIKTLVRSSETGDTMYVDETLPDSSIVHSCLRRLAVNRCSGKIAVAVAVLSIVKDETGTTYANIARALAADYVNLFYVDLEDESFIEYSSIAGDDELALERHGKSFFEASRKDALKLIHKDDREQFIKAFTKENILSEIDRCGTFVYSYRLLKDDVPVLVNMKAVRMQHDRKHIIIGVRNNESDN